MDAFEFNRIIELVKQSSGIIPRDSHLLGIKNFLEKRLSELKISSSEYYNRILSDSQEKQLLINSATVNETYFFREEPQFILLKDKIFPEFIKSGESPLRIWSAASASGEEIYSLYLLASSLGIKTECTASDINSAVLEKCRIGKYSRRSLRAGDGASFKSLVQHYIQADGSVEFDDNVRGKISTRQINLSKAKDFLTNQHIVFLRNVFIYFDAETKKRILLEIAEKSLVPGGYLFVSMNEVASLDSSVIPPVLEKKCDGKVFYFRKKGGNLDAGGKA